MIKLKQLLLEDDDYHGSHTSPGKREGASLDNPSQVYPEDIYGPNGVRYYGDRNPDASDDFSISIIRAARNRPNYKVKVYRAVPDINTDISLKLKKLNYVIKYYYKYGFYPMKNKIVDDIESNYPNMEYNALQKQILIDINNEIEKLKNEKKPNLKLNDGDWVTINKQYAVAHGKRNIDGKYKILSKIVSAKDLYTDGDSPHEWGYRP